MDCVERRDMLSILEDDLKRADVMNNRLENGVPAKGFSNPILIPLRKKYRDPQA